jgi:hypothetical protein
VLLPGRSSSPRFRVRVITDGTEDSGSTLSIKSRRQDGGEKGIPIWGGYRRSGWSTLCPMSATRLLT